MSQTELNFVASPPKATEYRKEVYEEYKPKKYYLETHDDALLEKALKDYEDELKKYKYYKELPVLGEFGQRPVRPSEFDINLGFSLLFGFGFGTVYSNIMYGIHLSTKRRKFRAGIKFSIFFFVGEGLAGTLLPSFQPQNRGLRANLFIEEKTKNLLDYDFDLYKHNEDIKYHDRRYPSHLYEKLIGTYYENQANEQRKIWKQLNL